MGLRVAFCLFLKTQLASQPVSSETSKTQVQVVGIMKFSAKSVFLPQRKNMRIIACWAKAYVTYLMVQSSKYFLLLLPFSMLSGCLSMETNSAEKAYRYWAGEDAPKELRLLNGKYWESPHFTKEYIMYLELQAPKSWVNSFIALNNLAPAKDSSFVQPSEAPSWFKPTKSQIAFEPSGFSQGSTYFIDTLTGHMLMYEIQL